MTRGKIPQEIRISRGPGFSCQNDEHSLGDLLREVRITDPCGRISHLLNKAAEEGFACPGDR